MKKIATVLFFLFAVPLYGSGFQEPFVSAADMGVAGASLFTKKSVDVVVRIPAALSFLPDGLWVQSGASKNWRTTHFRTQSDLEGRPWVSTDIEDTAPSTYAAWAGSLLGHRWAIGFAWHIPFSASSTWKEEWPGRVLFHQEKMRTEQSTLALGVEVAEGFAVSVSVLRLRSLWSRSKPMSITDSLEVGSEFGAAGINTIGQYSFMVEQGRLAFGASWRCSH